MSGSGNGRWQQALTCCVCGVSFHAGRRDARYCSAKCRKQMSLEGKRILGIHQAAVAQVKALLGCLEHPYFSADVRLGLGEIFDLVKFTDNRAAAAPAASGQPRSAPGEAGAALSVPGAEGTDQPIEGRSVPTGGETLNELVLSVKTLTQDVSSLHRRLDGFEAVLEELEGQLEAV